MGKSYIFFQLLYKNPKTNVYSVLNKNSSLSLGIIKWFSSWRQYCFFPSNFTVFSKGCMKDINEFIEKIIIEYKEGKHGEINNNA